MLNDNVRNAQAAWLKLDEDRLRAFIAAQPEVDGRVEGLSLNYPTSGQGISNGIAFVSADIDTGRGLERRDLVVRYAPGPTLLKQKSFSDEFLTMQVVSTAGIPAPKALWLDADGAWLGAKGYLMERVFGDIPAAGMFTSGMLAEATPTQRKALMLEAAGFHGRLRRAAIGPERVAHLTTRGTGDTPVEREVQWWMEEARQNLREGDDKLTRIRSACGWLLSHQPAVRPATLVHGDAQLCNLIYRNGAVIAALDWELAYLGHGESDLAMIIWLTRLQRMFERDVEGVPSDAEFTARYEAESGAAVQHYSFMRMMQIFKLVCVLTASAQTMPSFEEFWECNWTELATVWNDCRAEYGA
jgi:aminoglycoside phosphotransferase (APT) family kinase protein